MPEATTQAQGTLEKGYRFFLVPDRIWEFFKVNNRVSASRKRVTRLLSGTWVKDSVLSSPKNFSEDMVDEMRLTFGVSGNSEPSFLITSGSNHIFPTVSTWKWNTRIQTNQVLIPESPAVGCINIESINIEHVVINFNWHNIDLRLNGHYKISLAKV